jgi:hypothetical protein
MHGARSRPDNADAGKRRCRKNSANEDYGRGRYGITQAWRIALIRPGKNRNVKFAATLELSLCELNQIQLMMPKTHQSII